ncbi:hypothetical protein PSHT_06315 [Puccinia striiformis]|uniref:OTU domain-containing protein n=1 Tax=Puccinia striiformis TaxID=27350 RepID=A0A2S4W7K7_9BASI|nr:hypothetical protein PSHT_06315 [Puccinia striiformis]
MGNSSGPSKGEDEPTEQEVGPGDKAIPAHIRAYMNKIFDPLPDGNCGFCCIARALGYKVEGWFQVSGRGHREAGAYTKLQGACNTFLPLRSRPLAESEPIYLLHVNGNHWVLPVIPGKDGVKPISPPVLASRMTTKIAKNWLSHIQKGIALYARGPHAR